ncbi:hypothetical protein AVEN_127981-1 [Araneus ventricosus]|uniref:Uncharacterized protein n=1 Tax=Araneus ventricosus TaxID=182803 RepID=A0A4Y1ZZ49_ARAVE|nr:hypothetical protein AVEN_127981-1 [Araneus ventricosus]
MGNRIISSSLPPPHVSAIEDFTQIGIDFVSRSNYVEIAFPLRFLDRKKINRLQFGNLLNSAWAKSVNVDSGIKDFQARGIIPFDPDVIPHTHTQFAYLSEVETEVNADPPAVNNGGTQLTESRPAVNNSAPEVDPSVPTASKQNTCETPTKLLDQIYPIRNVNKVKALKRKSQNVSTILNTPENILKVKKKEKEKKVMKQRRNQEKERNKKVSILVLIGL